MSSPDDLPLDNPMLVSWEFASEERLEARNAIYRQLIEGVNVEELLFSTVNGAAQLESFFTTPSSSHTGH